jgi:phytoene dehydrogenase-like protein
MIVHLPDARITRFGDDRWKSERLRAFGPEAEPFWEAQERIADRAWDLSRRFLPLPWDAASLVDFGAAIRPRHLPLVATLGRTVASIMPPRPAARLRAFVDAQLLITAQTDAAHADLAYGSTALDMAREGTYHLRDGVSGIAVALARNVRRGGSSIAYGRSVASIETRRGRARAVVLDDGTRIACGAAIAAIPAQNLVALAPALGETYRARVASLPQQYGAFVTYCGLPAGVVPDDIETHHQLVRSYDEALGAGNSAFLSFSEAGDVRRARGGGRAVTLSTHAEVARFERAYADGTLPELVMRYERALLDALDRVVPGASSRAVLVESATPHTFARYTGRLRGLVGGVPQTPDHAVLGALGHRTPIAGLFLCGDTAFPGQSTVGASLSGFNAARAALREL